MLILTRRVGESIVVGDDIVLTVFEVRGDAVRVGIEAPRSVQVHRQEVYDELQRLNQQSVSPSDDAVDSLREAITEPAAGGPALSAVPDLPDAEQLPESQQTVSDSAGAELAKPSPSRAQVPTGGAKPTPAKAVRARPAKPSPRRGQ